MSRTTRKFPYDQPHRKPKGKKQAIINKARKKAIPPSAWDDYPIDNLCYQPYRVAHELEKKGLSKEEAENKLVKKFKISHAEARHIIRHVYEK